jgi:hypothetical protein
LLDRRQLVVTKPNRLSRVLALFDPLLQPERALQKSLAAPGRAQPSPAAKRGNGVRIGELFFEHLFLLFVVADSPTRIQQPTAIFW